MQPKQCCETTSNFNLKSYTLESEFFAGASKFQCVTNAQISELVEYSEIICPIAKMQICKCGLDVCRMKRGGPYSGLGTGLQEQ